MKKKPRTQLGKKGITLVVSMFVVLLGILLGIGYRLTSSPLMLELRNDTMIARYHHTEYSLPLDSIESVRLLEVLPHELSDEPNSVIAMKHLETKDYGHFFVPENVYIIGTMNDIDRSVDSMDFAMRRRFLIKDIKAEDTQKDMLTDDAIIAKMNALNAVIEGESWEKIKAKLGTSYSLGASYFQKYYKYNDFKLLWEYHLEGVKSLHGSCGELSRPLKQGRRQSSSPIALQASSTSSFNPRSHTGSDRHCKAGAFQRA